jgi:hypothetical protein
MKKIAILTILIGIFLQGALPAQEPPNPWGGKTEIMVFEGDEARKRQATKMVYFFDKEGELAEVQVTIHPEVTLSSGIVVQRFFYREEKPWKYEMEYSEDHIADTGYTKVIEYVGKRDKLIKIEWYHGETLLDETDKIESFKRFQFLKLSRLEELMAELYDPNYPKDQIGISAKYNSLRSTVNFIGEPVKIDELDVMLLEYICQNMGNVSFAKKYILKVLAEEDGHEYWVYMQKELIPHVHSGARATIRYYNIQYNGKLFLMCVGFFDVK